MKHLRFALYICLAGLALTSCSGAKKQLGLEKKVPDEFAVIKRAPLALPPGYELRPPQPGAPRPQEQAPDEQAKQVVFGETKTEEPKKYSSSEELFLNQAGANAIDTNIREKVDAESTEVDNSRKPVVKRLLSFGSPSKPSAQIVDAQKELERLQKNVDEGRDLSEGETPYIED